MPNRRHKVSRGHAPEEIIPPPRSPGGKSLKNALLGDFIPEDIHNYRIDRHSFTVYLENESTAIDASDPESQEPGVEHNMADRFARNMDILTGIDKKRPILVKMSSCGGSYIEGMKIFGTILACPNPVTVLATKWARSMTSIIPLAADRFVMRPNAQYMYHYGTYGFSGLVQEAETDFLELLKGREIMLRIYVARLKEQGKFKRWSEEKIRSMLVAQMERKIDVWLTATEAKAWGFADAVFAGNHDTLRATECNNKRRKAMYDVLRRPVTMEIKVT